MAALQFPATGIPVLSRRKDSPSRKEIMTTPIKLNMSVATGEKSQVVVYFMDSQAFVVKFLFASLGTVISIFWRSFFQGVAAVGSYARMARRPRLAAQSTLRSPPTNSLSGAVTAV